MVYKNCRIFWVGVCFMIFSVISSLSAGHLLQFDEMETIKASNAICKDLCTGSFVCKGQGTCEVTEILTCIPLGCFSSHPPMSTRKCKATSSSPGDCQEGEKCVLVGSCIDHCTPFFPCSCSSSSTGGGWIIFLHDCWYK